MKANYTIEAGDVRVIRPLIYVREAATRDFSQACKLPIINENCPACFEQPKVSSDHCVNMNPIRVFSFTFLSPSLNCI
jgi:tRNA(Ile)-lysidine synthase TilS/MesJ